MIGLVDTLVILLLAGLGFAACGGAGPAAPLALPAVLWLAFTTPALVRSDMGTRRLPNAITLPAIGLTMAGCLAGLVGLVGLDGSPAIGAQEPGEALLAMAATSLAGSLAARTGALGLGDVKLSTALVGSAWLISPHTVGVFAAIAAGAGVVAAAVTLRIGGRGGPRSTSAAAMRVPVPIPRVEPSAGRAGQGAAALPFGPCLLLGYWTALAVEVLL